MMGVGRNAKKSSDVGHVEVAGLADRAPGCCEHNAESQISNPTIVQKADVFVATAFLSVSEGTF